MKDSSLIVLYKEPSQSLRLPNAPFAMRAMLSLSWLRHASCCSMQTILVRNSWASCWMPSCSAPPQTYQSKRSKEGTAQQLHCRNWRSTVLQTCTHTRNVILWSAYVCVRVCVCAPFAPRLLHTLYYTSTLVFQRQKRGQSTVGKSSKQASKQASERASRARTLQWHRRYTVRPRPPPSVGSMPELRWQRSSAERKCGQRFGARNLHSISDHR